MLAKARNMSIMMPGESLLEARNFNDNKRRNGALDMNVGKNTTIWHQHLSNILDGVVVGDDCTIHSHVWIGKGVQIGNGVKVQAFVFIPEGVTIGNNCFIGPRVTFTNDRNPPSPREEWEETIVEDGACIGAAASILCGLTIGKGACVGMGAVVINDVAPYSTVVGNPARLVQR